MLLFDQTRDVAIVLQPDADEAVHLASRNLQEDLRRLSGKTTGFDFAEAECGRDIVIQTVRTHESEAYTVCVEGDRITVTGSDTLGTVYGIYAVSTRLLGVSPTHRMTDLFPSSVESLTVDDGCFRSEPRPVRFRGWFINDEDLLCDWQISGGHRRIDYPFYHNVMDVQVLDEIVETALRLELNLMIPASFLDIDNPDEEALVKAVYRRGMYVSQHHVEPMGVSYFTAEHYLKQRGYENETISFITNRARMEEMWRYYAEKWSPYADRVVWQFGLRGKADVAVWQTDPTAPLSMQERGAVITDAIQTQYDIVRGVLGTDAFSATATLWNEGSRLYGDRHLHLPNAVIPVFADLGVDQMFGDDFYTVACADDRRFGVYYHATYFALGPHFAEGCHPRKMAYGYRDAAACGGLCYSILNVSNLRPVHVAATMNARLLQRPDAFDADAQLLQLDRETFGDAGDAVNAIRRAYYDAFADFGNARLKAAAKAWHFYYREYPPLPFIRNAATDGQLVRLGRNTLQGVAYDKQPTPNPQTRATLEDSARRFLDAYRQATALAERLSGDTRGYFERFVHHQIGYMYRLSAWCAACIGLTDAQLPVDERKRYGEDACKHLRRLLEERRVLETGKWQHWHRGDTKLNLPAMLMLTQTACQQLG